MDIKLLSIILPDVLRDYFDVISFDDSGDQLVFRLEELNIPPEGFDSIDLLSKGFYEGGQINDFPVRGKRCVYQIRRRKWQVKADGRVTTRDWNIVASGTRMTGEFASFFKELSR